MARYEAVPAENGLPDKVWDFLLNKVSSEHLSYGAAVARAYTLNAFSTGVHADVIPFPVRTAEVAQ